MSDWKFEKPELWPEPKGSSPMTPPAPELVETVAEALFKSERTTGTLWDDGYTIAAKTVIPIIESALLREMMSPKDIEAGIRVLEAGACEQRMSNKVGSIWSAMIMHFARERGLLKEE